MKRKTTVLIFMTVLLAMAILLNACSPDRDAAEEAQDRDGAQPAEEQAADMDVPLCTLVFTSDYQAEEGFTAPSVTLSSLLKAVKAGCREPDNVIVCGDYTNDDVLFDYQLSPDDSIAEAREVIAAECPGVPQEDMIFIQGNHDAMTDAISDSGLHEYGEYLVYVLNTEYDFPWKQGRDTVFRDRVIAASEEMKKCFDGLIAAGETRPVIIAGHVPLHYTARTSSRHTTGDNMYSEYVFDVVNEAAKSLDIIYLFGHDHSKGWDCYLGGAAVYLAQGDKMLVPDAEDRTGSTDEFTAETLNFTYMNAGYTGYYMNCGSEEVKAGEADQYHAADETLTCTVAEIYEDRIVLTRYDENGVHILGAAGEADPYMGGADEGLIGPEHYSKETAGPAVIKRAGARGNGKIRADGTDGEDRTEENEEKDAA